MGKRKKSSAKPQGPKKKAPLATSFACLFCNHENSVTVKLDKKAATGELSCKVCGQTFQTNINYLSAAVDVYSDWIDACDAVAKEAGSGATGAHPPAQRVTAGDGYSDGGLDRDDDDLGIMDNEIGEADYND